MQNNIKKINKKEISIEEINNKNKNLDLENKFSEYEIFFNDIDGSTNFFEYKSFSRNNLNYLGNHFCKVGHLYFMQIFYCLLLFIEFKSSLNEKIKNNLFVLYQLNLVYILCKKLFLLVDFLSNNIFCPNNLNGEFIFNLLFLFDVFYLFVLFNEYNNIYENYYEYNPQFIMLFSYFFGMYFFAICIIIFKDIEKFYSNKIK